MKKSATLRDKNDGDLQKALSEKREELRVISFAGKGHARPHEKKQLRTDIARIMTEITIRAKTK